LPFDARKNQEKYEDIDKCAINAKKPLSLKQQKDSKLEFVVSFLTTSEPTARRECPLQGIHFDNLADGL
jgi:hypothetical protein